MLCVLWPILFLTVALIRTRGAGCIKISSPDASHREHTEMHRQAARRRADSDPTPHAALAAASSRLVVSCHVAI